MPSGNFSHNTCNPPESKNTLVTPRCTKVSAAGAAIFSSLSYTIRIRSSLLMYCAKKNRIESVGHQHTWVKSLLKGTFCAWFSLENITFSKNASITWYLRSTDNRYAFHNVTKTHEFRRWPRSHGPHTLHRPHVQNLESLSMYDYSGGWLLRLTGVCLLQRQQLRSQGTFIKIQKRIG